MEAAHYKMERARGIRTRVFCSSDRCDDHCSGFFILLQITKMDLSLHSGFFKESLLPYTGTYVGALNQFSLNNADLITPLISIIPALA
jgi:hypothetical protein